MRALSILRDKVGSRLDFLHVKRVEAFWRAVSGVMEGGQLWLTALGRALPGDCEDKHRIKSVDRLLGNSAMHAAMTRIYATLAHVVLAGIKRPTIAVDWTAVASDFHALSATVCLRGRALPILTCVYPNKHKCSSRAHREFLAKLEQVVPRSCTPLLVTDAGFYTEWFEAVRSIGWDFLGRVRNRHSVHQGGRWVPFVTLYEKAGRRPKDLGHVLMRRKAPRSFRFVLSAKRKSKGRKRLTRTRTAGRSTKDRQRTDQAREPWLLATSLAHPARTVVDLYAKRMQIEESFRDMKSHRYGWSLEDVRCRSPERIEIMLLLAAFGFVATQVLGLAAEQRGLHRGLQANTERKRRVFSRFFLGRLVLHHRREPDLRRQDLQRGFDALAVMLREASVPEG